MNNFKRRPTLAILLGCAVLGMGAQAYGHGSDAHAAAPKKAVQQAWGIAAEAKTPARLVDISMSDAMRFTPNLIEAKLGETIRLRIKNEGQVLHELVLGTEATLAQHAALMVKFPNMEHEEPYMVHVPPGKTGEITWTFNRTGDFDFACLIAGHYQAGMVGRIKVSKASK